MVSQRSSTGFTVVEMMVVLAVMGILVAPILGFLLGNYEDSLRNQVKVQLAANTQSTLSVIAEEVKTSGGALVKNTLTDPRAPSGGWYTNSSTGTLVLRVPALSSGNEVILDGANTAYHNEIVYYRSGSNLYRRTIRNSAAPGNAALTTCPLASASTSCPADSVLSETVSSFSFVLLKEQGVVSASTNDARSVRLSLAFSKSFSNDTVASTQQLTARFRSKGE